MNPENSARTRLLLGPAGIDRLKNSFVVIAGLGAVGGYAAEGIARAGVGHIRIIDFDVVHRSNINRQLYALESTLNRSKTEIAAARLSDINPDCRLEVMNEFISSGNIDKVLSGNPCIVIDAIDSTGPKAELIASACARGIPIISSMGAALRSDPQKIRLGKFSDVQNCPLAARIRKLLRKKGQMPEFLCVASSEPALKINYPQSSCLEEAEDDDSLSRGRKRPPLGSLPSITGIFGLTIANAVMNLLLEDLAPMPVEYPGNRI